MRELRLALLPFRFFPHLFAFRLGRPGRPHVKVVALSLLALSLLKPGFATAQSSEQDIETPFRAGQAALRQGDFLGATEQFKKVLALDPNLVEAQINLGLAYQSLLDYDQAVHYLAHALLERPNLAGPNIIVGLDYIKLGSPASAAPYLRHALELNSSSTDAHEGLALYELTRENFEGAAEQYRKLAELNPDKADALFILGHQYLDLAVRLAYRGARLYPQSAWGHRFLGDMFFERERWEEAGKEYAKALAIDPRQSGLHTQVGEVALRRKDLKEAEAQFHQELAIDSRYEPAWLGLASLQLAAGKALEAQTSVDKVWQSSPEFFASHPAFPSIPIDTETARAGVESLRDQPDSPAKQFLLTALYSAANEPAGADRALEAFQSAVPKWPPSASHASQVHDAAAACRLHHYAACIAWLQKSKPLTSSAYLTLGKAYFVLRQFDLAAKMLSKVHGDTDASSEASYWLEKTFQAAGAQSFLEVEESSPDSWRTHQLKAEGFALRQDQDNAIKEYQAAIQLRPDAAELHEALGEFELDSRMDDDAQKELEQAGALDPSRTKALYLLGRLYVLHNENQKAIPFLVRALKLQPNLDEASGLLGTAYVRVGQFADAVSVLERAAPVDHYGNVHYQLGMAYRKLGKADLAKKAFERSQEIRRSSLESDQARIMGPRQVEPNPQ
jgi:tetratricopeptide (TPR) repeat protein